MRHATYSAALALAAVLQAACSDAGRPTQPSPVPPLAAEAARAAGGLGATERLVSMMDACEPESFNAVLGAGACVRRGGVTFANFIAQLTEHQKVGSWHFAPPNMNASLGQTLVAVNRGGEAHTFTEVETFGGGFVEQLNELSGTPVPAPECLRLGPEDFIPPGGSDREEVSETGTELYQCCIHPWMRTVVHVRS